MSSDMVKEKKNKKKASAGFRLELFNFFIILFTVIVTVALSVTVFRARATYDNFHDATEQYIICRTAGEDARDASDYLTIEVRTFIQTGEYAHLDNYFYESKVVQRREKAIAVISEYVHDDSKVVFLKNAVDYSKELTYIEYYAMRLALEANEVPFEEYPDPIKEVELSAEDQALSSPEKLRLANEKVQNIEYSNYKESIYKNIGLYMEDLLKDTRVRERQNALLFSQYQYTQITLIILLIGILMITVAMTSIFLIRPLRKSSKLIVTHKSLPVKGPAEMRTFAVLYNKALESTKTKHEKLSHDASHDSLTGIQNRIIFDTMCRTVAQTTDTAIILLDVDNFKTINDTRGHDVGDGILKKVAKLLRASFRSDDIICRIGGDEFTVIMQNVSFYQKEQVAKKMGFLVENLSVATDDLPAATVSVGIAFGDSMTSFIDLYKRADDALYGVKTSAKNGIKVYGA